MRVPSTRAEDVLASALRRRGLRFRREASFGIYKADFYFPSARLTVEVDGHHHRDVGWKRRSDYDKCDRLARMGIRTLRYSNESVLRAPNAIASAIELEINRRARAVCRSPRARGR